jgi:hypothetical protein
MFAREYRLFCLCEERPKEATWQSLQHKSACQKRLLRFAVKDRIFWVPPSNLFGGDVISRYPHLQTSLKVAPGFGLYPYPNFP